MLGGSAIVKPAAAILAATRQLKNGQLDVRIPTRRAGTSTEFTRIADGFNLMADSLAQRQRDLETELARSHLAYATLDLTVNSMREGLIAVDTVGRVLLINEAASRLLVMNRAPRVLAGDWPQSQGLFKPGTGTLYAPEELPLYKALQGESGAMQHILVRNAAAPEGRLISASYRPMQGSEGVIGALVVFTDITGLQNLQLAQAKSYKDLRESEEKLREAQRLGRIGDWELDLASQTLSWSDEACELFGLAPGSFDGRPETLERMVHPDDRDRYRQVREQAVREGADLDMEYRIITPAGEVRWVHNLGRLYLNAQGQAQCRKGVVQDITKRKQSELALAASADLLRRTGEMAMIGGWALILDGMQTILSEQIYRIYEMDSDKVLTTLAETLAFYAPQARPVISAAVQAAIEHGTSWDLELPMVTARGRLIWGRSQGQALAQDGKATQLVGTLQDITHRKLAEQAMLESEQRYTALFESAPVPMWVYDVVTWRFLMVNEAAVTTYGYSGEEFLAMEVFDLHPESEHARMRKRLAGAEPLRKAVWNHRRKDGSLFPGVVVSKPIQYAGRAARFVVSLDMIAQRKAENEVQDYLFTLQRAADAAQAITWHRTLSGMTQEIAAQARGVIGANQALLCLSAGGDTAQTTHALSVTESHAAYWNLLDLPDITGLCASVFESNRSLRLTQTELESLALCRSAGESAANKLPAMRGCLAVALMGRDGKNIGLLQLSDKYEGEFTQQDEYVAMEMARLASIAIENARLLDEVNQLNIGLEQKVAERTAELTRQEALFRALAEEAPQVVWTANPRGQVTYVNRAWFVLMGGEEMADFGAAKWLSRVHPEDLPDVQAKWQTASQGKSHYASIRRLLAKDGSYHTLSSRAAPVLDDQGEVSFWVGIDADITEIKAIEASLRLSNQELEAFSYSVSHDLRSPLNTIEGFSRLLVKQLTDDSGEKARHYLSRIQAGVAQMGQLIEDMLSLAQVSRAPLRHEPVDLTALAQGILAEWRGRAPERQVAIHIETGLQAHGDARLIKVVLENLLGNAWKFSSRRADAEISVGQRHDSAGLPVFFVRDNGAGFDMAYADKLFSPFQRLHAASEFAGTGVGLATVHRIIARHGGALWPESAPDCGATFFFTLPRLPTLGG